MEKCSSVATLFKLLQLPWLVFTTTSCIIVTISPLKGCTDPSGKLRLIAHSFVAVTSLLHFFSFQSLQVKLLWPDRQLIDQRQMTRATLEMPRTPELHKCRGSQECQN